MFVAEKVNGANLTELLFKPRYNSGFKVGLGWDIPNWDHWNVSAEYTWYHANMHSNFSGDPKVPMGNPEMKSKMTQSLIAAPVSNGAVIIAPVPTATLANQCNNPALPCISFTTSPFQASPTPSFTPNTQALQAAIAAMTPALGADTANFLAPALFLQGFQSMPIVHLLSSCLTIC